MSSNSTVPDDYIPPTAIYGYVPTFWVCCTFLTLFSVTTIIHFGEALFFHPRRYWLIPTTVLCGVGEIIGWSARLWSSKNPIKQDAFLMQISTTIIAPVFLTAGLYTILGLLISRLGPQFSRLRPKTYLKIFVTADVLALVVQAIGGGLASGAQTLEGANNGAHIMLGGILFQMAAMVCYTLLAIEFLLRFYFQKPLGRRAVSSADAPANDMVGKLELINGRAILPGRIGLMIVGLALATFFVFIRSFYRTVELSGGWHGHIIRTEIFFNVLDGAPIVIALFVLNLLSPAFLL